MILVVGLGNPGGRYASTRHNAGYLVVDRLGASHGGAVWRDKFNGQIAQVELAGAPAVLLKPGTYMNESGRSVQPAVAFYKVELADLVVVHDELDLPFGVVRLKCGGGDAGHKGLKSIRAHLSTGEFTRVRVGIGRPPTHFRGDIADFVLDSFPPDVRDEVERTTERAAEAVRLLAERGAAEAMQVLHRS